MDETLADHWQNNQRWIKHNQELTDHLQQCGYDERDDNLPWQPRPRILLPPVGNPEKIICIGLNYRDHAIETGAEPPSLPIVFSKFNTALTGDHQPIELPAISEQVDYEAELVVVIGKTARHVTADRVSDHIFGYTAGHDVSSRDWQKGRPGGQWLLAKSFDTFAPLGPCVVTQDALPDAGNLRIAMKLNDVVVQNSKTDQLIFDIPDLIVHLSQFMTLRPGDLIFTGTPPGVGAAATPPRYLKDGDTCQVMIEGIGCLTNHCATANRQPTPCKSSQRDDFSRLSPTL